MIQPTLAIEFNKNRIKIEKIGIHNCKIPYGLVVRILAFHAGGPGSIPGVGRIFLLTDCE